MRFVDKFLLNYKFSPQVWVDIHAHLQVVRFDSQAPLLEGRIDTHAPLQVVGVDKAQFETTEKHA